MRKVLARIKRRVFWPFTTIFACCLLILLVLLSIQLYSYWENNKQATGNELKFVDHRAQGLISLIQTIVTAAGGVGVLINIRLTENRSITQRFTDAVHQLGNNQLDIRLGGIYALERIAKDSARDHWTIMEILAAYVRKRTRDLNSDQYHEDVQSVIFVLGRRNRWNDQNNINLIETKLNGISFECTNFDGAIMRSIQLRNSKLMKSSFRDADLEEANIRGADLTNANLEGANLTNANLSGATLYNANLRNARLDGAILTGVLLRVAPLLKKKKPHLKDAILTGADITSADFTGATFCSEQLDHVKGKNSAIIPKQ